MGFWIYMFIMDLLLPIVMLLFGRAFLKKAPKEINYVFGYRTSRSMKNRDTWEFAYRYGEIYGERKRVHTKEMAQSVCYTSEREWAGGGGLS